MFTAILAGVGLLLLVAGMSSYPLFVAGAALCVWALLRGAFHDIDRRGSDERVADAVRKALEDERRRNRWR